MRGSRIPERTQINTFDVFRLRKFPYADHEGHVIHKLLNRWQQQTWLQYLEVFCATMKLRKQNVLSFFFVCVTYVNVLVRKLKARSCTFDDDTAVPTLLAPQQICFTQSPPLRSVSTQFCKAASAPLLICPSFVYLYFVNANTYIDMLK